jgi:hypothetical protein
MTPTAQLGWPKQHTEATVGEIGWNDYFSCIFSIEVGSIQPAGCAEGQIAKVRTE